MTGRFLVIERIFMSYKTKNIRRELEACALDGAQRATRRTAEHPQRALTTPLLRTMRQAGLTMLTLSDLFKTNPSRVLRLPAAKVEIHRLVKPDIRLDL